MLGANLPLVVAPKMPGPGPYDFMIQVHFAALDPENVSRDFYMDLDPLYLVLYNAIYVVPLSVIVIIFTVTLGKKSLSEWQGRILKLVSGTMMLGLGGLLLFDPAILSNAFVSFLLLIGAVFVSAFVAFLTKKFGKS